MHDDGPTLLFQRGAPEHGERCTICPFRPAGTDRAAGTYPPRPVLPFTPLAGPPAAPRRPAPGNAPLPRPALLTLTELRGTGTLVLPDALHSAGPDAATIERPSDTLHRPPYHPLAAPDITILKPVAPRLPPRRPAPRHPPRTNHNYLILNLSLGLLIVAGLVLLAVRDAPSAAPSVSASE